MANMYDKPQDLKFINTYVSPNFGMMLKAGASMQDKADKAELSTAQMEEEMLKVQSMSYDTPFKDALISEYEDAIAKNVEENGGSYYKSAAFIKKQRKKLHRDLTRGNLAMYQGNYDDYSKWYTEGKEEASKNEINPQNFELANRQALRDYETSRKAGNLDRIQLTNMMQANDYHADALAISGAMEGNSVTTLGELLKGEGMDINNLPAGHYERTRVTTDQLTSKEIYETVLFALKSNPKYKAELDQGADLKMKEYDYYIKQKGKTFMEERGDLTKKEKEQIEKDGFNSNDENDVEKWARNKMRENVRNEVLVNASVVASNVDDYFKQEKRVTHFKDDAAIKAMSDKLELQGSAFGSGSNAHLMGTDLSTINTNIATSKENLSGIEDRVSTLMSEYDIEGIEDEGKTVYNGPDRNTHIAYSDYDNTTKNYTDLRSMLNTNEGREKIINRIIKKTGVSYNEALQKVSVLKENVSALQGLKAQIKTQEGIVNNAKKISLSKVSESDWVKSYKDYFYYTKRNDAVNELSYEEYKDAITTSGSADELFKAFGSPMATIKNASALSASGVSDRQRMLDAGYDAYGEAQVLWDNLNAESSRILSSGYSQYYTKLDLVASKGTPTSVSSEISSAKEAIADPSTRIVVNGMDTNILRAFGLTGTDAKMGSLKNLDGDVIFDKGKPFYLITADVDKVGSQTILAEIPGRASDVHNTMEALSDSPDKTVSLGARTYLGAELLGDYWEPEQIGLLKDNQELPITLAEGESLGTVRKKDGYLKLYVRTADGMKNVGPLHNSPDEVARTIYNLYKGYLEE